MKAQLRYLAVFVAFALALVCCAPAVAQVVRGSISGRVTDPQGAVVAGAEVKAKNQETGVVTTTGTDSSGDFRLNLLPVGSYTVEVSASGFKTASQRNVAVLAGQDSGLGLLKMTLGEKSTTIEVSAEAPLIETTQAQVTNTFSGTTLNSFAGVQENEGLDNLALFVPGVNGSRSNNFSNSNGGGGFSVQGLRGRNNDQQVDGQNNNDNSVGGPGLFISSPEFVQQYVLITNNFGPEYGRNAGSVVNIITKNGTNSWHGSVFGSENNSYLNALSNQQKQFGKRIDGKTPLSGPPRSNDEFSGGTVGGPIAKNKMFIFGGFDNEIIGASNFFQTSGLTPTPAGLATLNGCFPTSQSLQALNKFGPYSVSGGNPVPFSSSGNPTLVAVAGCGNVPFQGITRVLPTPAREYDFVIRHDMQLGSDNITSRYIYNRSTSFNNNTGGTAAAGYPVSVPAFSQMIMTSWTHNFGSRMVNEARVGFGRLNVEFGGNSIGNTVVTADQLSNGLTNVSFNSRFLGFGPATNIPQQRIVNTWQGQDNWNYVMGKHSFKSGINWTYQRSPNIFLPTINGQYRFTNFDAFIANTPNRVQVANGPSSFDFREYDTFAYFGDDWKIKSNLTLNLGVTWSYYGQPANLFTDITNQRETGPNAFWRTDLPIGVRTFPRIDTPTDSYGPSIGFAWSPEIGGFLTGHGKTVVRGGYRMLYDPPVYNIYLNIATAAPDVFLQTFSGAQAAALHLSPNPLGPNVRAQLQPQLQTKVFDPRSFAETTIPPNFGPDKVHSWSFGIEREVTKNSVVEVRYAGNHAYNLFQTVDANPLVGAYQQAVSTAIDPSGFVTVHGLLQDFPQLAAGFTGCPLGHVLPGPGQPAQSNQAMGTGRVNCDLGIVRSRNNTGYSDYNGVQTEFRANNLFKQLTVRTGYTFSKSTDNVSEIFSTGSAGNTIAFAQNPINFTTGEHGISGLDFTHRWTFVINEQLPFFKDQHGLIGKLLGGWGFNVDYIFGSGQPYTPAQSFEAQLTEFTLPTAVPGFGTAQDYFDNGFVNSFSGEVARPFLGSASAPESSVGMFAGDACSILRFGIGISTANRAPVCALSPTQLISVNALGTSCLSLDPNAPTLCNAVPVTSSQVRFIENTRLAAQLFGTPFGNVGRNVLRDAISNIANLSVTKQLRLNERSSVEFRATALNVMNHFNFSSVDPFMIDAGERGSFTGFADPSTTGGNGRRLLIGARVTF